MIGVGLTEILGAVVLALAAIAAGLFKLWRGQAAKAKDAERRVDQAEGRAEHRSATRDAGDAAKREAEQAVEDAREAARQGRRDHFESDR